VPLGNAPDRRACQLDKMTKRLLSALLLAALACHALAETESEATGDEGETTEDMFLPVASHHLQDNTIVYNHTRYAETDVVVNPTGGVFRIAARWLHYPDRDSLLHPAFVSYWIHCIAAGVVVCLILYLPGDLGHKLVIVLLPLLVSIWIASWIWQFQVCRLKPPCFTCDPPSNGQGTWWLMFVKSLIVNIGPVVPMLGCIIGGWGARGRNIAAGIVYFILWANVFWTLFFPWIAQFNVNMTVWANWWTGASLCISLLVHLAALCNKGVVLFQVEGKILYGYGTSLSWLICYTIWNGQFVLSLAPGLTLQDILFWCLMFAFYYASGQARPVEDYFAMARPIQLGLYIGLSDWLDLIPFFRVPGIGLDVNRHAYFLFLASANFVYSLYVLFYEIKLLVKPDSCREYKSVDSGDEDNGDSSPEEGTE